MRFEFVHNIITKIQSIVHKITEDMEFFAKFAFENKKGGNYNRNNNI